MGGRVIHFSGNHHPLRTETKRHPTHFKGGLTVTKMCVPFPPTPPGVPFDLFANQGEKRVLQLHSLAGVWKKHTRNSTTLKFFTPTHLSSKNDNNKKSPFACPALFHVLLALGYRLRCPRGYSTHRPGSEDLKSDLLGVVLKGGKSKTPPSFVVLFWALQFWVAQSL